MRATARAVGLVVLVTAGSGCSETTDTPPGTVGEAGYGVFQYRCVDEGDAVCSSGTAVDSNLLASELGIAGEIPARVAVGGHFDLDYRGAAPSDSGGSALPLEIVAARADVVSSVGGFRFLEPARVAFLARSPQGVTADFIHVSATEPASLELWAAHERPASLSLVLPAPELVVGVVPRDADELHLAGALSYDWSSSDESVVRIAEMGSEGIPALGATPQDDEVRVVGLQEGSATLRVTLGTLAEEVTVTVEPEVTP